MDTPAEDRFTPVIVNDDYLADQPTGRQPLSLEDFAPPATRCSVCMLREDLRTTLEQARLREPKRFTFPVISEWLRVERHLEISEEAVRSHFRRGHVGSAR